MTPTSGIFEITLEYQYGDPEEKADHVPQVAFLSEVLFPLLLF